MLPTQKYLREALDYDPLTGSLTWRERPLYHFSDTDRFKASTNQARWNTRYTGTTAFNTVNNKGYLYGSIDGVKLLKHRVIYKWWYNKEPPEIDHDDRDQKNNRIKNLNPSNRLHNNKNHKKRKDNPSGHTGVVWWPSSKKFRAFITVNKKRIQLGMFTDFGDACFARKQAEIKYGFHPQHGT